MKVACNAKIGNNVPRKFYETDLGHDVYIPKDVYIHAGKTIMIDLEFTLDVPRGILCEIRPRSSSMKKGLHIPSAPIDPGYEGNVHIVVTNLTEEKIVLKKDDRVGQLVFSQGIEVELVDYKVTSKRGSGGFGSTGD